MYKKISFTLAEVLITLTIIGIVAAMTIPVLVNNTKGEQYKTAYKKALAMLNTAVKLDFSLTQTTIAKYPTNKDIVSKVFLKHLQILNSDDDKFRMFTIDIDGCSSSADTGNTFTTVDGIKFCVNSNYRLDSDITEAPGTQCDIADSVPCHKDADNIDSNIPTGNVYIDVNGDKKPNMLTVDAKSPKDIYQAMIFSQKVAPWGAAAQDIMYHKNPN